MGADGRCFDFVAAQTGWVASSLAVADLVSISMVST
jgi:hypothetical protein